MITVSHRDDFRRTAIVGSAAPDWVCPGLRTRTLMRLRRDALFRRNRARLGILSLVSRSRNIALRAVAAGYADGRFHDRSHRPLQVGGIRIPIHAIPEWLALAKLTRADIGELVVLRFAGSHALLLKLKIPAPQVVDRVLASGLSSATLEGYSVATIPNPSGKPGSEIWQWVAPRSDTLIIGGARASRSFGCGGKPS